MPNGGGKPPGGSDGEPAALLGEGVPASRSAAPGGRTATWIVLCKVMPWSAAWPAPVISRPLTSSRMRDGSTPAAEAAVTLHASTVVSRSTSCWCRRPSGNTNVRGMPQRPGQQFRLWDQECSRRRLAVERRKNRISCRLTGAALLPRAQRLGPAPRATTACPLPCQGCPEPHRARLRAAAWRGKASRARAARASRARCSLATSPGQTSTRASARRSDSSASCASSAAPGPAPLPGPRAPLAPANDAAPARSRPPARRAAVLPVMDT